MGGHTKKRRTRLTRAEKEAQSRAMDRDRDSRRTSTDLGGGSRWRDPTPNPEAGRQRARPEYNHDRAVPLDQLLGLGAIGRVTRTKSHD